MLTLILVSCSTALEKEEMNANSSTAPASVYEQQLEQANSMPPQAPLEDINLPEIQSSSEGGSDPQFQKGGQTPLIVKATEAEASQSDSVSISIRGDEEKGEIIASTTFEWINGDTVLDLLKQVTRSERIPLQVRGMGMFAYVEGIANLFEFDHGPESGWLFKVNGELAQKGAGSVKLAKGDTVEWFYTVKQDE